MKIQGHGHGHNSGSLMMLGFELTTFQSMAQGLPLISQKQDHQPVGIR